MQLITMQVRHVRSGTGLQYFLTDHLGSTVAVTNASGTLTSQQRYLPFGQIRTDVTTPNSQYPITDLGYTGQRALDPGMGGLMDYHARFYSPALGRFTQPDTITPGGPQGLNRYSYVSNSPINFNDPTGHMQDNDDGGDCKYRDGAQYYCNSKGKLLKRQPWKHPSRTPKKEPNICRGNPPHVSQYLCGLLITAPSVLYPKQPTDIVVGSDNFTDFEWAGKTPWNLNGIPVQQKTTSAGVAWNAASLIADGVIYAHYNSTFYGKVTDQYAQAGVFFVDDRNAELNYIPGIAIYNHTGGDLAVSGVMINKQPVPYRSNLVSKNTVGVIEIPVQTVGSELSIQIYYSAQNQQFSFGYGTIEYKGPIGLP